MDIKKDLKLIKEVFDKFGVRLFILYGGLLGLYRDKKLIPYDDDIDFGIIDPIDFEIRKKIGHALLDLGFKTQPISFNVFGRMEPAEDGYNGDDKTGIIVCEKEFHYTFFFYQQEECDIHGKEYVCIPKTGALKLISIPIKYFDKTDTVKLYGIKLLTPYPIKDYLTFTYGNFKKPEQGKHAEQYQSMHSK